MNKLFIKIFNHASKHRVFDSRRALTFQKHLFSTSKTNTNKVFTRGFKFSASAFLFCSILYHQQTQCKTEEENVIADAENANTDEGGIKTDGGQTDAHIHPPTEILPIEMAKMTFAPKVPPPIRRRHPALVKATFEFNTTRGNVTRGTKYDFWTINGSVPGPFLRCRVGDVLELTVVNNDESGMPHNIDLHAVMGPGGGTAFTTVRHFQKKTANFRLLYPGLFIYHCSAAPIPLHVANGMYGLILVEPEEGLTRVDKEYYVLQSEFYFDPPGAGESVATMAYDKGLLEQPDAVVFNGREGSLTDKNPLKALTGDTVRIFFGNAGPNKISSFHIIGTLFEKVYREGDLVSPPARNVQTTLVPPGGSTVVEFRALVPGNYTLSDHAIFRLDKGAVGFLNVSGPKRPDIYASGEEAEVCDGCKVHP